MFNQTSTDNIASKPVGVPTPTPFAALRPQAKTRHLTKPRSTLLSSASVAAYAKDIRLFNKGGGTIPCNAVKLIAYIVANRLKVSPTSLYRRAMAVRHAHMSLGLPSPTDDPAVRPLLRALQLGYVPNKHGVQSDGPNNVVNAKRREPKPAAPMTRKLLAQMLDAFGRNMLDRRDRALLLLGFMGALKRSALVAINVGDLNFTPDALIVTVRDGETAENLRDSISMGRSWAPGRNIAIPLTGSELCAATAVKDWCDHAALDPEHGDAPVFLRFDRGGDPTGSRLDSAYINVVLKVRLKAVGVDPKSFSAQSLRRGRLMEIGKGTL